MKKVFMVHGFEGSPNGGWRPWLMGKLEDQDIYACALPMPSPDDPILSEWVEEIARQVERNKGDEVFLVGHSLGVPAILNFLSSCRDGQISGVVLVSGPLRKTDNDKVNRFIPDQFDFSKLKSARKHFVVIHGDNDPLVPISDGEELAEALGAEIIVVQNGGHLNGSSGWRELPQALDTLLAMIR